MAKLADDVQVIDADTHYTEPYDLWTSRAPKGYEDRVLRVEEKDGLPTWFVDGREIGFARGGGVVARDSSKLPLPDASVDLLFCHQTFHHLVDQDAAIAEFFRVLKPGGTLLFAESTRRYIHSWIIRLLFRHPMDVQKTAPEYLGLVRAAGFAVPDSQVSYPFLWWSREDLGLSPAVRQ